MENKLGFWYNRKIAVVVAILLIIISGTIGSGKILNKLLVEANKDLYTSTENITLLQDFDSKVGLSYNFLTMSNKFLDKKETEKLETILKETNKYSDTKNINAKEIFELNQKINSEIMSIKPKLDNISTKDKETIRGLIVDMDSVDSIMSNTEYNAKAENYNKVLKSFPVSFFRVIGNYKELGYFK